MKKENAQFDFVQNEHDILGLWKSRNVFEKMKKKNEASPERYRFLDGPITANGSMCMHHVWGRTLKDAYIKYNTLKGRSCQYQNGFDAQGMWVEVEVEKLIGLNDKKAIVAYGLENFTEKCIERVNFFADMQTRQSIRLGQLMDWEDSYFTNSDHNIESIWHFLKVCNEKGILAKSYKSMPWCPRCGTSLSEHEMTGSYREMTHKAVFVKVKLREDSLGEHCDSKLLVWTTTPWTLASNVAIAIHPDHDYVKVKVNSDVAPFIIGKNALKVIKKDVISVLKEFKGSELIGIQYEPILPLKIQNFDHTIVPWKDVSENEGSGAVHIAPGCGAEDYELGKKLNLKTIVSIDDAGCFTDQFEYLTGLSTEKCEEVVFDKLREHGTMYMVHDHKHKYPYCWRCKTNVVFKLVDGWDIKTAPVKPALFRAVKQIKWQPEFLQKNMEAWLENMGDWNISRRRFYGLPLPIYPCDCGHVTVVGSREELAQLSTQAEVDALPHLHRPYIDAIKITCPKCKRLVDRILEVGDCWLDAGITPFSTKKYFTDKEYFAKNFPSEVVLEMREQIRLWFYSMLFMSVVLMDCAPYERCIGHSTILDEEGKKFSKTGPNNIKFDDAAERFGVDVLRWLFASSNAVNDMRFGPNLADESRRKLLAFWNNYVFFNTYAVIDNPDIANWKPRDPDVTDIWLNKRLNKYIADCDKSYADFRADEVCEATESFVEDLSNFYIRVNRRRFWKNDSDESKMNAYWSLYNALKSIIIVTAPITPFLSEYIWQNMVRETEPTAPEFVMLADFPKPVALPDTIPNVLQKVDFAKRVIGLGHKLRATSNIKVKQPLAELFVKMHTNERNLHYEAVLLCENIIKEELNVKQVTVVEDEYLFNVAYLTVNFKKAGEVLKGEVQELKKALESLNDKEMERATWGLERGQVTIGRFKNLPASLFDKKVKSKPGYTSDTEDDLTVVLDTNLTPELVDEGILREIIRGIQVARQEANLDIAARIALGLSAKSMAVTKIIDQNAAKIADEVLATTLSKTAISGGHKTTAEAGGEQLTITFKVAEPKPVPNAPATEDTAQEEPEPATEAKT